MVADLAQEWGMTLLACLTAAGAQLMPLLRRVLNDHQTLEGGSSAGHDPAAHPLPA